MCVVSMVGDHFNDHWKDWRDRIPPINTPLNPDQIGPIEPITIPGTIRSVPNNVVFTTGPTRQEFDDLKKEVEHMKKLLIKAKLYDEANNEPNCEMEEKVAFLKKIAEYVGVNLDEVFGPKKQEWDGSEQMGA